MSLPTKQIILQNRPTGWVTPENFKLQKYRLGNLQPGEILIKSIYMSLDPYMRGRMDETKTYAKNFEIGKPLRARVIGQVTESRTSDFNVGELVLGITDWANYSIGNGSEFRRITLEGFPITHYLGVLGMPGMTAWVGMNIAAAKTKETVLVSAASGAVGQIVGQIARINGCRTVGFAGTDKKVEFLIKELGFDAAFNYRSVKSISASLKTAAPDGIDIYFDNVGGIMLEAALDQANNFARFVQCGMISQYNLKQEEMRGIRNLTHIHRKRIRMQGFIVSDHNNQLHEFMTDMKNWLKTGKITYRVDVTKGIENAVPAFISMLKGGNFGKQLIQLAPEP